MESKLVQLFCQVKELKADKNAEHDRCQITVVKRKLKQTESTVKEMLLFRERKHIQHKIELEILQKAEGELPKTKPVPQLLDKRVQIRP